MRIVVQRVAEARVTVGETIVGQIGPGLCLLVGIGRGDSEATVNLLADKITQLRIFADEQGKMNRSVASIGGEILVVSQFTLYGDWKKGNRPSFSDAAPPAQAERLYNYFVQRLRGAGVTVATGQFQTQMNVSLTNEGPVTLILEL